MGHCIDGHGNARDVVVEIFIVATICLVLEKFECAWGLVMVVSCAK